MGYLIHTWQEGLCLVLLKLAMPYSVDIPKMPSFYFFEGRQRWSGSGGKERYVGRTKNRGRGHCSQVTMHEGIKKIFQKQFQGVLYVRRFLEIIVESAVSPPSITQMRQKWQLFPEETNVLKRAKQPLIKRQDFKIQRSSHAGRLSLALTSA